METANTTTSLLPVLIDSAPCDCAECRSYCRRPCWPIPSEIATIVAAGEGSRLMLDWWEGDFHEGEHWRVFILSLALRGRESRQAPEVSIADPFGGGSALHAGCVFHGADGRCSLHDRRLKPAEGRVAHHAMSQPTLHRDVAQHWDTDEGRRVVRDWCATHGLDDPYEEEEF